MRRGLPNRREARYLKGLTTEECLNPKEKRYGPVQKKLANDGNRPWSRMIGVDDRATGESNCMRRVAFSDRREGWPW